MEKKIDETEKKFEETSRLSEERLRQAHEAESKIIGLKTTVQRCLSTLSTVSYTHIAYVCMCGSDFDCDD